jgi:hypothetical protein
LGINYQGTASIVSIHFSNVENPVYFSRQTQEFHLLRYFRINDPYRLLGLLVLLVLICLPLFVDQPATTYAELTTFLVGEKVSEGNMLYTEIVDHTPPLASWFYGLCDLVFGRNITARHLTAFILLFLQTVFIGIIFIDKRVFTENTFIPSLVFSLVTLISFDNLSLTADVIASGVLLLALNSLLTEIEFRVQRDETIFNIGIFAGLASLLSFSYAIFLPGIFFILLIFTRNGVRKYLLMLTGFLMPHVLLWCAYFMYSKDTDLIQRFYVHNILSTTGQMIGWQSLLMLGGIPLMFLVVALFVLNRQAHLTKYQAQIAQAMFLWLLIGLAQLLFASDLRPQSLLPLAPVFSFYITHLLLLIRKRKFAGLGTWLLLTGIVATLYLSRYGHLRVDYSKLYVGEPSIEVHGKRLLILENNPSVYLRNTLSPAFINRDLTRRIFENPDSYGEVLLVNRMFENDLPEIIIDPENRMEKFFNRLPALEKKYRKSDDGWVLVSN